MKTFKRSQRGDTIVEVLIALAIISAVLAGAYAVASRSLQTARQSQERGEALKVAEAQIEKLKYMASDYYNSGQDPLKTIFDSSEPYCILPDLATGKLGFERGLTGVGYPTNLDSDIFANYKDCKTGFYNYAIRYSASGAGPGTDNFWITVRWENVSGTRDEIIVPYRLHQ